jgi:hypothetical protein
VCVGIFLVLVGVALLVVRFQSPESFRPIFQGPGRLMVSGPVGLVVIVIGVFCIAFSAVSYKVTENSSSLNPAPSISPQPILSSHAPAIPQAKLTSPVAGTEVSRSGFTASGTDSSLGSDTIWILDYDGGYTIDEEAEISTGHWSAFDGPLGNSKLPFSLIMRAVLADTSCAAKLARLSNENDYNIPYLPSGCTVFGQTTVNVTRA